MSNPSLVAFRDIVKNISKELDIKYNKALKVASQLQKKVKEKNPNIQNDKLVSTCNKYLSENANKYKQYAKTR